MNSTGIVGCDSVRRFRFPRLGSSKLLNDEELPDFRTRLSIISAFTVVMSTAVVGFVEELCEDIFNSRSLGLVVMCFTPSFIS